ncbi:hypothetical protein [Psychromonas sp. L1A2]|uniref:hypothetical protein n=1 Tax=Psychromonas sp. L1A2 TaxID=2686356 RepID=UPI00135A02CB|nr:hypothetical protein [Psychromonas sp. L1A2]
MKKKQDLRDPTGTLIPELSSEWTLNVEANKYIKEFYLNGEKCPSYEVSWKKSEILARYSLIQKDLKQLIEMLSIAINLASDIPDIQGEKNGYIFDSCNETALIRKSLYISLVITYGKCFASANGRRLKLDKSAVFNKETDDLKVLHEQLIEARNEYIAHGGNTDLESSSVSLVFHPDLRNKVPPIMSIDSYYVNSLSKSSFEKYQKLIVYLNDFVINKINVLYEKVYEEHIISNVADLYNQI